MDKNAGEDASGWETKGQKKTCHLALVLETLLRYMFQDNLWLQKRKQYKPK